MLSHTRMLALLAPLALALLAFSGRAAAPPRPRTDLYGDPLPPGAVARLGTVRLHRFGGLSQVRFTPDGRRVTSTNEFRLFLWDTRTGRLLRTFNDGPLPDALFYGYAFSRDGKTLVSVDWGGEWVRHWDTASGKVLRRVRGPRRIMHVVVMTPDGTTIAYEDQEGAVRVWDVKGGRPRGTAPRAGKPIRSLAISSDSKQLVILDGERRVRVVAAATGKELRRFEVGNPARVALAPDAGVVATFALPDGLWLWEVASGKKRRLLAGSRKEFYELSFSPDGRTLLGADRWNGAVHFWDVRTRKLRRTIKIPELGWWVRWAEGLILSPDGSTLAASENGNALHLWDAATGRPRPLPPGHGQPVAALCFSPDGKTVLAASSDSSFGPSLPGDRVHCWDAVTGRLLSAWFLADFYSDLRFSPDGRWAVFHREGVVQLWEARTGKRVREMEHGKEVRGVAFSPDGRTLVTATEGRKVRLWDLPAGKLRRVMDARKWLKEAYWLAFSPDGRTLAVGDGTFRVHLWDVSRGQHTGTIESKRGPGKEGEFGRTAWQAFFSPDGHTLFACKSGKCILWDVAGRREADRLEGGDDEEYPFGDTPVALSPDGRLLARLDRSKDPGLWETASGRRVFGFPGRFRSAAFSPDGRTLAAGYAEDCSVLLWDLQELFAGPDAPRGKAASPERLWDELAGPDAGRAYRAVWRMAAAPATSIPFLRSRLRPAPPVDARRLARLLADLDSDRFAVREKATRELRVVAESVESDLRRAAAEHRSPEVRDRARRLVRGLTLGGRTPEQLRPLRAVAALEYAGSAKAREVLKTLAKGAPGARLTREAKAALARLEGRGAGAPRSPEGSR